ncbi:MAG: dTDP-glucose 4,6-dehydratase [Candidatus Aenigmatarchaeota archaeon]
MRILITGGAGFIGSNFVHHMLEKHPDAELVVLDKLTYAGRLENLKDVKGRITFVKGDICSRQDAEKAMAGCDTVFNFAAETHVDRSIQDAGAFIQTDVFGTFVLLELARKLDVKRFIQISTDEVYGQIIEGSFKETDVLMPRNPYSASKAGADRLAYSYFATYGLPVVIPRSSNNFGPRQFPEKLIPLFVTNLLRGRKVPVYGDGMNIRDWLFVKDNCEAIDLCAQKGRPGEVYNIGTGNEKTNLWITRFILQELGKPQDMIEFVKDRPGHDKRYSLDCTKAREELGWTPRHDFETALRETISWYKENTWWWEPLVKEAV